MGTHGTWVLSADTGTHSNNPTTSIGSNQISDVLKQIFED